VAPVRGDADPDDHDDETADADEDVPQRMTFAGAPLSRRPGRILRLTGIGLLLPVAWLRPCLALRREGRLAAGEALLVVSRVVLLRLPWLTLRVLLAVALGRVLRRLSPARAGPGPGWRWRRSRGRG
jgi:hypothetical protein